MSGISPAWFTPRRSAQNMFAFRVQCLFSNAAACYSASACFPRRPPASRNLRIFIRPAKVCVHTVLAFPLVHYYLLMYLPEKGDSFFEPFCFQGAGHR
jgi:hypothetical protein